MDPSTETAAEAGGSRLVGAAPDPSAGDSGATTVFEKPAGDRPLDKRKRVKNDKPEDVDGYLGPWGGFVDEQRVMKPTVVSGWCAARPGSVVLRLHPGNANNGWGLRTRQLLRQWYPTSWHYDPFLIVGGLHGPVLGVLIPVYRNDGIFYQCVDCTPAYAFPKYGLQPNNAQSHTYSVTHNRFIVHHLLPISGWCVSSSTRANQIFHPLLCYFC